MAQTSQHPPTNTVFFFSVLYKGIQWLKMKIYVKNHSLKNTGCLWHFFYIQKRLFSIFLLQKLDPCSRAGPVWVAVEVPYGSRGGPVR